MRNAGIRIEKNIADYIAIDGQPSTRWDVIGLNNKNITSLEGIGFLQNKDIIKQFLMHNNLLTEIPAQVFKDFPDLRFIDFSRNRLTEIPAEGFKGLANLQGLFLQNNQISEIHETAFKGLINLEGLHLENNQLTNFDAPLLLQGNQNLKFLDVRNNKLPRAVEGEICLYKDERNIKTPRRY